MPGHAALASFTLAAFLFNSTTAFSQKTKEFAPKNEMYTLTFPVDGKLTEVTKVFTFNDAKGGAGNRIRPTKTKKGIGGGQYKLPVEGMQSDIRDTSFTGASIGIPAVLMRNIPADQRFDVLHEVIVKELKGNVKKDKDVKQGDVPGKEYQIELPKGMARMQLYTIAGWVIYVIVIAPDQDALNDKQVDQFFDSLKLTDKAQETFRNVKR